MTSGDGENLAVPKFGSFKSKEPKEEAHDRKEKRGDARDERRKRSHQEDRHERRRRDSRESKRRRERSTSHGRHKRSEKRHTEERPAVRSSQAELFVLDTKGDPLIRRYGTLERSKVPSYYRHGRGRVLGTAGKLIIYRDGPNDYFSLRMPGEGAPRYRDREGLRSKRPTAHPQPIPLRRRRMAAAEEEDDGFLSLQISKKIKSKEESSDNDEGPSYRSIEGKAKAKTHDSDFDSDSDSEELDDTDPSPLKWKSIQLNRRVKENPEDIDSWLELVNHQDDILRASAAEGNISDNEAHSYSEIKVSMLEKALENTKDTVDRERVLVPLMREGTKVWSNKIATKKWSELGSQADSHALWRVRLDFAMTSITEFEYGTVKNMLFDRVAHLLSPTSPNTTTYIEAIEVFLLATRFIHDGGYKEQAVAAWQALLELTFFRPDPVSEHGSVPDSFQDFWESEVPRIGEAGAVGWKQYVLDDGGGDPPQPAVQSEVMTKPSRDVYKRWSQVENAQSQATKMPSRTLDDGTDDDPFRVVTSTDILPLLFMIPGSLVADIEPSLIDAFLIFCGLPPASSSDWARSLYRDPLLAPLESSLPKASFDEQELDVDGDESIVRRPPRYDRSYSAFAISPELLFASQEWFRYIDPKLLTGLINGDWLESTLSQLVGECGLASLSEYYLAVSFVNHPASVKKTARQLLKQSPANVYLYNSYALAEYARGNTEVANKVLESAIASPAISQQNSRYCLYHSMAWILLLTGDITSSKKALAAAGGASRTPPSETGTVSFTDILKARTAFTDAMSESLSMGHWEEATTAAECLMLLQYLTSGEASEPISLAQGNISAAMQSLDNACAEMKSRAHDTTASQERLVQFGAHLLYIHASKGSHRKAYIREQMAKYLRVFPSNAILVSMLEWSDAGLRIVDETRQLLRDQTLLRPATDCVGSRMLAIQHELGRGNVHTTRAAFEQAVRSDACKSNIMLWVWYIRFTHEHRRQLRVNASKVAVDVFYRALRHCPWAKTVLLEAFLTLAGDMGSDELRSVYGMMASKGLRVHVELDEFMQDGRQG